MSTAGVSLVFMVTILLWAAFIVLMIKSREARGDDRRRYDRLLLFLGMGFNMTVCCVLLFGLQGGNRAPTVMVILSFLILILTLGTGVLGMRWMQSERYFRRLYSQDPGFCGRCGYNLTGNVSGVCPECGWKLPDERKR